MKQKYPPWMWAGLVLLSASWALNWSLTGLRTHLLFFPLWLGYALTIDGLVFRRKGTSLLARSWRNYLGLFLVSAPAWWLFELLNLRTQNWSYLGRETFSDLEYALFATLNFSTVIPAVFGAAELASTFAWIKNAPRFINVAVEKRHTVFHFILGWSMLTMLLLWPRQLYGLLWMAVFFIVDPINSWLDNRSLFKSSAHGDWRPVWALWTGGLICGFFWEMWNFWSYPKWVYSAPGVEFLYVFEMPLLGYLGYLPFSLELFALYHLVVFIVKKTKSLYIELE